MKFDREEIYKKGYKYLVGGVNSPVRAFKSVDREHILVKMAKGANIYDLSNKKYIDYCGSWGALIFGHSYTPIIKSIAQTLKNGTSFGFTNRHEIELAYLISSLTPSIQKVRFVNSGTEAVMSAIRLARAFTQKKIVVKFDGCYHGHSDSLLVKAGSGLLTSNLASSNGVPDDFINNTISIEYNNIEEVKLVFEKYKDKIACVVIEPIAANMGLVIPDSEYHKELREITRKNNSLLIYDEVITGFRVGKGSAQGYFGIEPDITCFGKIIGGGMPVGAYGGKKEIFDLLSPIGDVYQAGTLSGNPISMIAGLTTLKLIDSDKDFYTKLKEKSDYFIKNLKEVLTRYTNLSITSFESMFTLFFMDKKPKNYKDVLASDTTNFKNFFNYIYTNGILFPPSQFETCFISSAHRLGELDRTISIIEDYFAKR